jgi:hypothetical protein
MLASPIQFWVGSFVLDGAGWLDFETAFDCRPYFIGVKKRKATQLHVPEVAAFLPFPEGPK